MAVATATKTGKVVQIIGPVVDIEFEGGHLPAIYNAVRISGDAGGQAVDLIVEVEQHLGENRVRIRSPTTAKDWMETIEKGTGELKVFRAELEG